MRQVFLDTETTGLYADSGDRIVEIGCVEMVNRRLTGRHLHFYFNPQRSNHEEAVRIHGLSDAFLADKPLFAAVVAELLDWLAGAQIVIHNAAFDLGFMNAELKRLGRPPFDICAAGIVDTLALARDMFPGKSNSLDALCKRFEVDNSKRSLHGALLDAELLAEVYIRMTRGQDSLVIEADETGSAEAAIEAIDLSRFELPVIEPDAAERDAHAALLAEIGKASGGRSIWQPEQVAVA
jgi:DNA polymerase III subunit epsilon